MAPIVIDMLSNKNHAQVVVIGGGPAGLSLSCLLAHHGISVICVDKDPIAHHLTDEYDGRTTAISFGSRNVLSHAGVWQNLNPQACPIKDIRILDGDSAVLMQFLSDEMQGRHFGWIIENSKLRQEMFTQLEKLKSARHIAGCGVQTIHTDETYCSVILDDDTELKADLVIGADGRFSFTRHSLGIKTRDWVYRQKAHVCVMHHEKPHENVAYEHFREEGPFAILPMQDTTDGIHRSAVVWSDHHAEKRDEPLDDDTFMAAMRARFPDHYGSIELGPYRAEYPLGYLHAEQYVGQRTALVAEAAHAMHPIAGQGLNMSLRDVAAIAELIIDVHEKGQDIGAANLLNTYQKQRRFDNAMMLAATDGLTRLYSMKSPPVRFARKMGVRIINRIPRAKKFFMGQAMGLNGRLSRFVREEAA